MAAYSFTTHWRAHAPVERVWEAISQPLEWPDWWKGVVAVEELEPGEESGLGALHCYTWKSALPYRLAFDMRVTKVEEPLTLEGRAGGELEGDGVWTFTPDGDWTDILYRWDIVTTRRWMNLLAPLLRPAFTWNHDWVMRSGARGLSSLLDAEVELIETSKKHRWPLAAAVLAAGALGVFLLRRRRSA